MCAPASLGTNVGMASRPQPAAPTVADVATAKPDWIFIDGEFKPADDAKVSVKAHVISYGTGTFDGLRATWNDEQQELYLLEPLAHFQRLEKSARTLLLPFARSPEELVAATVQLLRRNEARRDTYVRPIVFLAGELLSVRLHGIEGRLVIYTMPFPDGYIPTSGVRCLTSSWRRVPDTTMPVRAKIVGSYVNPALAKTEAVDAGADEAIMLTVDGSVSEASTSNIFLRRDDTWVTPAPSEDILEGITRRQVIELIGDLLGETVTERTVDRSELYSSDEILLCGTAAQIAPVVEVDRRAVGSGRPGERTLELMRTFIAIARGDSDLHPEWAIPVYGGQ